MRAVKHFRLEGESKKYLLALLPIDFGKLVGAIDQAIVTQGFFLLVIDDDAYVEADPYGWVSKDRDLMYAHFYLRENAATLRGGAVLRSEVINKEVKPVVDRLSPNDEIAPGVEQVAEAA